MHSMIFIACRRFLLLLLFQFITLLVFSNKQEYKSITTDDNWRKEVENFRKKIVAKDKDAVKSYFNFPLEGSAVWSLVDYHEGMTDKPFTEKDFYTYYNELFSKEFVALMKKMEINNTPDQYGFYVDISRKVKIKKEVFIYTLLLHYEDNLVRLTFNTEIEGQIGGTSVSYLFYFDASGQMKLSKIDLSG